MKSPFKSLQNRNYGLYWMATSSYYFANFSQTLAQGWLVYEMTKSPFLLGLVTAISGIPSILIALFGGVLADRLVKKNLLFIVQVVLGADALVLAVLISTGVIQYWHVAVFALVWRTAMTFGLPARLSFVSELVTRTDFMNAYALYYVSLNLFNVVGPALAGAFIGSIGIAGVFFIIVACEWFFNVPLLLIHPTEVTTTPQQRKPIKENITEILRFAYHSPTILTLMGIRFALGFLTMPAQSLEPAFAAEVLGLGAAGLGMIQAARGIGSLTGSLLMSAIGESKRKSFLLLWTCILRGCAMFLFANTRVFPISLFIWALFGIGNSSYTTLNSSLFQLSATDGLRGRIMGLYMMSLDFIGPIPISVAAESVSLPFAFSSAGAVLGGLGIAIMILRPNFRRLSL
ncbi:MAG: MFS transporter [Candidatus Hodarchaeota archaeon]